MHLQSAGIAQKIGLPHFTHQRGPADYLIGPAQQGGQQLRLFNAQPDGLRVTIEEKVMVYEFKLG
ncbi:MAG: hypothetical protein BroJett011_74820 [Chloroflexota bacterium]|nr:MAG: hypothetical protein BroJett011_74820 [Chloroflexota bacterium]